MRRSVNFKILKRFLCRYTVFPDYPFLWPYKHEWFEMSEVVSKKYCSRCFSLTSKYFERIKGKVIFFLDFCFNKNLARCKIFRLLNILFSITFLWFFHVTFPSNNTPKNPILPTHFIRVLFIFNVGKTSRMLSLCLTLRSNVSLVLTAFKDDLLLLSQRLIFDSSLIYSVKKQMDVFSWIFPCFLIPSSIT